MSDTKLELKDGWEEVTDGPFPIVAAFGAEWRGGNYEYRVIRRRKMEKMPEIRFGDGVTVCVTAERAVVVNGICPKDYVCLNTLGGSRYSIPIAHIERIFRENIEIWERKP